MFANKSFTDQLRTYFELSHLIQQFESLQNLLFSFHFLFYFLVLVNLLKELTNSLTIDFNFFDLADLAFVNRFEDYFG
jgi:hypothetical protein